MTKTANQLLFAAGIFYFFIHGFCLNNSPALEIKVWNTALEYMNSGDLFSLGFNISHRNDSMLAATNVSVTWFLPGYFIFKNSVALTNSFTAEKISGHSNVKIEVAKILLGEQASGSIVIELDPDSVLGKWYHEIVVPVQVTWHGTNVGNSDGAGRFHAPLMPHTVKVSIPGCLSPLGMRDGRIKDHHLDAKVSDPQLMPTEARPSNDAWCAKENVIGNYIQVSFTKLTKVTKVSTWGRRSKDQWVTKYHLNYSLDGLHWDSYKENGFSKIMVGTKGPSSQNMLFPFATNMLRIIPLDWKERICMRFELHGCIVGLKDNCIDPVGIENGVVPDEGLSDSMNGTLQAGLFIKPNNARLNKEVTEFPFGWMARSEVDDWLQTDLGSTFKITKVAIQGSYNSMQPSLFYVETYKVRYSNNGVDWKMIADGANEKTFDGPKTSTEAILARTEIMLNPIIGRYFRIIPVGFALGKVLRFELYGCASSLAHSSKGTSQGFDLKLGQRSVILDPVRNNFYVCFPRGSKFEASCILSKGGKTWRKLDVSVARLLAVDVANDVMYGITEYLSHVAKRGIEKHWNLISEKQWKTISNNTGLIMAVHLPDILVGKSPKHNNQWKSKSGMLWGASGEGIHIKSTEDNSWRLLAFWKCCGF